MKQQSLTPRTLLPGQRSRKIWAEGAHCIGLLMLIIAVITGYHAAIAIGAFLPVPFSLAAMLNPSRFSIALALACWGAWFTALYYILN